jgi:hypothetical protein
MSALVPLATAVAVLGATAGSTAPDAGPGPTAPSIAGAQDGAPDVLPVAPAAGGGGAGRPLTVAQAKLEHGSW